MPSDPDVSGVRDAALEIAKQAQRQQDAQAKTQAIADLRDAARYAKKTLSPVAAQLKAKKATVASLRAKLAQLKATKK